MTEEIKIESGVPIPSRARVSSYNYPFSDMQKGQSYMIPVVATAEEDDLNKVLTRLRHRLRNAVNRYKKTTEGGSSLKFAVHQVLEKGVDNATINGVRVWRVE